jgi:hypothetical protein
VRVGAVRVEVDARMGGLVVAALTEARRCALLGGAGSDFFAAVAAAGSFLTAGDGLAGDGLEG